MPDAADVNRAIAALIDAQGIREESCPTITGERLATFTDPPTLHYVLRLAAGGDPTSCAHQWLREAEAAVAEPGFAGNV